MKKIFANGTDEKNFLADLKKRSGETNKKVTEVVTEIIENVKENGDEAVKNYTLKFDGNLPKYYEVPRDVINDALTEADQAFVDALPGAKIVELDEMIDKNEATPENVKKLLVEAGVDTGKVTVDAMAKFREIYLSGNNEAGKEA